ncbi:MAG TPA: DUF192 domain-containing protein, partial [Syntrophomonadaceae bacterium]|nr:DUF192 domain-containing protein [Syntrophomonadaceae bacterium]
MQILQAKTYLSRVKGLLGRDSLPADTGLLLKPCKQVHTFFMKFTIDVIFLDKHNKIIHLETLKPFKISRYVWKARAVVEFAEGTIERHNLTKGIYFSVEEMKT